MGEYRHYTEEEMQFVRDNAEGISVDELTRRFNERFNTNKLKHCIAQLKIKLHVKSNYFPTRFGCRGHVRSKAKEVGSMHYSSKSRIYIKTANPDKWRLYHHVLYEKYHGVKLEKGDNIVFLDGNPKNFDIDNLERVDKHSRIFLLRLGGICEDKEINMFRINLAKIQGKLVNIRGPKRKK